MRDRIRAFALAFFRYVVNRLNERSTWAVALPALAGLVGVNIAPEQANAIGTIATGLVVALPAIVPDGKIMPIPSTFDEDG